MTLRNREEAARAAEAKTTNEVGMCQKITHSYYDPSGALSAGDRDADKDADAIDGWESEPKAHRHTDRNPPRGVPGAFRNANRNGHGHRLMCLGNGLVRSSDFSTVTKRYAPGVMGTGTIEEIERAMGLVWLGWSDTITGHMIPLPPPPPPDRIDNFLKGGPRWDVKILDRAAEQRADVKQVVHRIDNAVRKLPNDRTNTLVKQFKAEYAKNRVLRMGILNQAVANGRTGTVKHVRDEIRSLINSLKKL